MSPTRLISLLVLIVVGAACQTQDTGTEDGVVVTWETPDGNTFRTLITATEAVARVQEALQTDGRAGIPNGELVPGDGGINVGHDWHLQNVELADMTVEVCDGTVSMVDADLTYWLETVRRFCPWDARVVAVEGAG